MYELAKHYETGYSYGNNEFIKQDKYEAYKLYNTIKKK